MDPELKAPGYNRLATGICCAIMPLLFLTGCTGFSQLAHPAPSAASALQYAQANPVASDEEQDFKIKPAVQSTSPATDTDTSSAVDTTASDEAGATLTPAASTALNILEAFLPAPGQCRVWYLDREAGEQPAATEKDCRKMQGNMPANAVLIYRPRVNSQFVEVCHFDPVDRGRVVKVGFYDATTGKLQREETF